MSTKLISVNSPAKSASLLILADKKTNWAKSGLTKKEAEDVHAEIKAGVRNIVVSNKGIYKFVCYLEPKNDLNINLEAARKSGASMCSLSNKFKVKSVFISNQSAQKGTSLAVAEGMALANYQFLVHVSDKKSANSLHTIGISSLDADKQQVSELNNLIEASELVKNLVNEPVNYLNSTGLANAFVQAGKEAGFKTEVLNKQKIEALKMGGLLSVNQGSVDPPTFTIMEYKPANAVNKKPIVLVGKGVVYDTGGLSLKPTGNSMDYMKCDMAGAATVMGIIYSIAKNKLPLHIVALAPSTDNRPGFNAFAPGDIITMYNGKTVEMLNSDAEGRMILADALTYAAKFEPELVIDMATLTGAAHRALGEVAIAYMGTADADTKNKLEFSGNEVYERLVEFPLWDEYGEMLKSDIADFKNIGGAMAGHITAGKFLEKFTSYPWIHLDIAGVAYLPSPQSYRSKYATAIGMRLVYDFLKKRIG